MQAGFDVGRLELFRSIRRSECELPVTPALRGVGPGEQQVVWRSNVHRGARSYRGILARVWIICVRSENQQTYSVANICIPWIIPQE